MIFGASGFIGANLYWYLTQIRSDVIAVVGNDGGGWRLKGAESSGIHQVNARSASEVNLLIAKTSPRTVFNCIAYGAYSFQSSRLDIYETNFIALINITNALRTYKINAFINSGSSSEYGSNCSAPEEGDDCRPNSDYAVSKIAGAKYLEYLGEYCDLPCLNLRLYSVYGPLEDTSRLMPNLIKYALEGRLPPFVNKSISRDFVYVEDVCKAFVKSATNMRPEIFGQSINIGTGYKTTIEELAAVARQEFKIEEDPKFSEMPNRQWDTLDWYSNPTKARKLIGWESEIKLTVGISRLSEWIKNVMQNGNFEFYTKNRDGKIKGGISAIIACYKDELAIPIMYQRLKKVFIELGIPHEIIFVNDCSPDNSEEIIRTLSISDANVIGISHSRNFGSQMAFRSGMEIATQNAVVLMDGDLQDPPELIEKFYEKWTEGNDIVYGRRIKREMSLYQNLLYKLYYRVFSYFSYLSIPLDAGDFSLIDQKAVKWVLKCSERDLFLRGIRAYVGFKQAGVDYIRPKRMFGESTNSLLKNIGWAKKGIFSFSETPLSILTSLGLLLMALSSLAILLIIVLRIFFPDFLPKGVPTIAIFVIFFGALNLFGIGIVGEYVAKIMIEVKSRPKLIRTGIIRNGTIIDSA